MQGKVIRVGLVLTIMLVACLFTVPVLSGPISSGEHPWGSDRTGDTSTKPAIVDTQDTVGTPVSTSVAAVPPDGSAAAIVQAILSVTTSLSMLL